MPTPGTIPELAIKHLLTLPPGTRLATAVLAEAIGHDSQSLSAYLVPARDMGWLCSAQNPGGRMNYWWLGPAASSSNVAGLVAPQVAPAAAPPIVIMPKASIQEAKPEVAPLPVVDAEFFPTPEPEKINIPLLKKKPGRKPKAAPPAAPKVVDVAFVPEGASAPPGAPKPFRCGVFSDGELLISKAGQNISLERIEFETLLQFLNRMCGAEVSP